MDDPTDTQLMNAAREGDRDAFGRLVDRHKDRLVNYLTRLAGCRDRAEDLAQESFLRLYRSAPVYDERGRVAAFLYAIATNLLRSEERRRRRWKLLVPSLASGNGHGGELAAEELALAEEAGRQVTRALAALPLRMRVPMVLHEIEGWTYDEIARLQGVRQGTVKSRIARGRDRLRHLLEPYWLGSQGDLR